VGVVRAKPWLFAPIPVGMIIAVKLSRAPSFQPGRTLLRSIAALALCCAFAMASAASTESPPADTADEDSQELHATGMTFIGSRGEASELVLQSHFATFFPDDDLADLREVHAVVNDDEDGESFEMTCDHAELNVETNDFRAEGNVRGTTSSGQHYTAPWVQYEHDPGLLHSDAPVVMVDGKRTYRGEGFEYRIEDRVFRLLRNVSVVETP